MRTWGIFFWLKEESVADNNRSRGTQTYEKYALSHHDLLERLRQRGLQVPNEERALRYLRHIGYFRLSPYVIPFKVGETDRIKTGTAFDDVLSLYVFDRELRLLVLDALERVEVSVRSSLTDHMSLTAGGPFWYEDVGNFSNEKRHKGFLEKVDYMCEAGLRRSPERTRGPLVHQSALEHYLLTYGTPERPPSWIVVEELTIGQLEKLIGNLSQREDRTAIARSLGITEPLLTSWLLTYVRVRNICAHHGRLWNRVLGVYPKLPISPNVRWLDDPTRISSSVRSRERLYPVLVSLQCILSKVSPSSSWAGRLDALLRRYPRTPLEPMGIPEDWRDDAFWREAIAVGRRR